MNTLSEAQASAALRESRALLQGSVTRVEQTPRATDAVVSQFYDLALTYSADSSGKRPRHCLLKQVHPEMFRIGKAEADFYRWVAEQDRLPPALVECYGTLIDEPNGLAAILMPDIGAARPLPQWPITAPYADCSASVRALAGVHARWWNDTQLTELALQRPLPQQNRQRLQQCSTQLIDTLGDGLSAQRRALLERVIAQYPELHQQRLASSGRRTIVHGDAHLWNFLIPTDNAQPTMLIDWQLWGVDFAAADLAYMMALQWFPERRARFEMSLLGEYVEALHQSGVAYSLDLAEEDYRFMVAGLLTRVVIFASVLPAYIWWPHLERAFLAFDDLDCEALLADH